MHLLEITKNNRVDEIGKKNQSGPEMNVDFNNEQPQKNSLELLATMRGIESIKKDNEKLVKAIKEKEELNEILLKNMTHNK
jgi:hypothetical protein